jgi:hypothetical protein
MHTMEAMRPVAAACADAPRKVLRLFDQAAAEQVLASYPQFESIHRSVHVRVTGLPVDDSIRDLRWVTAGSQTATAATAAASCGRCSGLPAAVHSSSSSRMHAEGRRQTKQGICACPSRWP